MAFCVNCGNKLESGVKFCANCGHPVTFSGGSNVQDTPQHTVVYVQAPQQDIYVHERKSKGLALTLCFFLGWMGAHEFYLRKYLWGSLYLIFFWTFIPLFLSIIDFIIMLLTPKSVFHKMYDK